MSNIATFIVRVEKTMIGCLLMLATATITYNVIARRLGFAPPWGEEVVRYSMIWITFIGSALCFRRSAHFGIDVIKRVNHPGFQKAVTLFVLGACMIFAGFLFYYGLRYTLFTFSSGQKTPALGWPIFLVYMSVPAGSALTELHLLGALLSALGFGYQCSE